MVQAGLIPSPSRMRPLALLRASRLGVLGDRICLRDPRGRTRRPSLAPVPGTGDFEVWGDFTILQSFSISPSEGKAFVESSGDPNPIHVEDSVVPGAMTAARFLLVPEILIKGLAVRGLRVKFRAFSWYNRPSVNVYSVSLKKDGNLGVQLKSYQQGVLVAEGAISGSLGDPAPHGGTRRRVSASESAEVIRSFLRSVRVDPEGCFASLGADYPRAFLAALPPGEMVKMGGAGGLLNVLDLEFPDSSLPQIEQDPLPTAQVERTRPRNSFQKILAKVGSGIKTYCRGYATVLGAVVLGKTALRRTELERAGLEKAGLPGLSTPT